MRVKLPVLLALAGLVMADVNKSNPESVSATQTGTWINQRTPATLAVTALSAANTAVTATLPAVASQFHYITLIQITRTCTAVLTGSAALAITTTNLPGSLAFTAGNACAIGSTNNDVTFSLSSPLRSSVVNTATTIVCPAAGAAVVCRINVFYFAAP